jgi:hypothetical protein
MRQPTNPRRIKYIALFTTQILDAMLYIESLFYPRNIGYKKCKTFGKVAMTSSLCTIQKLSTLSVDFDRDFTDDGNRKTFRNNISF